MGSGNAFSPFKFFNKRVLFARPCAGNRRISKAWPHPQGTLRGSQTCKHVFLGVGDTGPALSSPCGGAGGVGWASCR